MGKLAWFSFEPSLEEGSRARGFLLSFAASLAARPADSSANPNDVEKLRRAALLNRTKCESIARQGFVASVHILTDLVRQGWSVKRTRTGVKIAKPEQETDPEKLRTRIRAQLHAERDAQLRQPATQEFLKDMERRRFHKAAFPSIYSLMRDGPELSASLKAALRHRGQERQLVALSKCLQPYLQFVSEDGVCEHTGIRLIDIWRYFRHTWASPYKSVPGRSMMVLMRDAGAPYHPVMGIAALSSAAVAMSARDEALGWTVERVLARMKDLPTKALVTWLTRTSNGALEEIYRVDFLEDRTLSPSEFKSPTEAVIARLDAAAEAARKEHHRYMRSTDYKKNGKPAQRTEEDWLAQARLPLFRSKRAAELSALLEARMIINRLTDGNITTRTLPGIASDREGKAAIAKLVRRAKAERVGTAIGELTVCGAVPPYNELLAGKLVSLLMVGPPVVNEYRRRYGRSPSVIASSMAGRPIVRPADVVYVGTTSLYGQRPSQYDRITFELDCATKEPSASLRYRYLGKTKGIGTIQFSDDTVNELARLLSQSNKGQRVNSVFGEGVNPRLRKIRDGLELLGLDSEIYLDHGAPRLVYGVELARNTPDYLLGLATKPNWLFTEKCDDMTSEMVRWWLARWVLTRVAREEVITRIAAQKLTHPVQHAARVARVEEKTSSLFDD
jgi:hypothetical protein